MRRILLTVMLVAVANSPAIAQTSSCWNLLGEPGYQACRDREEAQEENRQFHKEQIEQQEENNRLLQQQNQMLKRFHDEDEWEQTKRDLDRDNHWNK